LNYRDETPCRVPLWASYPNNNIDSGWVPNFPIGGTNPPGWDIPHAPSVGYFSYLISGRWPMLELLQFSASRAILDANPTTRYGGGAIMCINGPFTTRGVAWAWRTMGEAAAISPTLLMGAAPPAADAAMQPQWAKSIDDTAVSNKARFITGTVDGGIHQNAIGYLGATDGYVRPNAVDLAPADEWWGAAWMICFQNLALGRATDLGIEGLEQRAVLAEVRDFSYQFTLRLIGDDSTWNWRICIVYAIPIHKDGGTSVAPNFMSTVEAYAAFRSYWSIGALSAAAGETLLTAAGVVFGFDQSSNVGDGYGAPVVSVLSLAVDHGIPGALAKLDLVRSASNFDPQRAFNNPVFAQLPREPA
jgi:hypothetical protein